MGSSPFIRFRLRGGPAELSLRSIMYGRIVVSMLLCGLVAAACVYAAAELLFTQVYASSRESSVSEAEGRLALFDLALARAESDSLASGRRALLALGGRYSTASRIASADRRTLSAEAKELGVSEIYLIDRSGVVAETSFAPDRGLDLLSLGESFAAFIKSQYGRGEIADQRLSQSSITGTINNYQYYSPKGSDFIIEVSTRLDDGVARSFPGFSYGDLVDLAFSSSGGTQGAKPLARIIDLVSVQGISTWSLFQQKADQSKYAALVAAAERGEEATAYGRTTMTTVKPIKLAKGLADFGESSYFAVFELDLMPLIRFRLDALLSALASCGVAALISFIAMKRAFDLNVAARIERLRAGIARAADGRYDSLPADYGRDEIGAIGRSVDSMVKTILEKEERLRVAQRMETVGVMAGGLAHDFNNVLTGISGTVECIELLIGSGKADPDEILRMTSLATRTAKRGGELVRSLLDISSARPPERRPTDLAAVAREAAELAVQGSRESVRVLVETPSGPLFAECDGQAILRAVLNLCINGVQAMTAMRPEGESRGGKLTVRAEARPGEAAIVVEDEGVGIEPDDIEKVLTPFFSTKPRGLGTGLGLAIALSIAESHGGRLEIRSVPGRGSTFAIVLPA
jgi:signal transduction histidine kinase